MPARYGVPVSDYRTWFRVDVRPANARPQRRRGIARQAQVSKKASGFPARNPALSPLSVTSEQPSLATATNRRLGHDGLKLSNRGRGDAIESFAEKGRLSKGTAQAW